MDRAGKLFCRRGFTSAEITVAMGMMTILFAVAAPFFVQWRDDLNSRKGARGAYDMLRQARSRALSTNFQHMVSFDPAAGRFRMAKGSRAYNTPSDGWDSGEWVSLTSGVTLRSGTGGDSTEAVYVQFNADGTARLESPQGTSVAPSVTISLQGGNSRDDVIVVGTCGRITLQ